ncbi:transglycosylase SLT domain-containing protein [Pseudoalteromonas fenneropenaei]|uniref:Transglycosylase SLT domain-containing protein n=1 Tax=Pseudoalteromonas fenneropenaei TaxID=1737459 RepID=A0ABV7CKW9_9GAMM
MKKWLSVIGCVGLAICAKASSASVDHQAFKDAEKIAWSGNHNAFRNALAALEHPLSPYVEMAFYKRHPSLKYQEEITRFLSVYEHTPLEWPVRESWLHYLKRRGKKGEFIEAYRETRDAELQCLYLRYQLDLGAPASAILPQVDNLWTVGTSQPKVCDPLFSRWQKAGRMTQELIWQRITKTAQDGQSALLPYLKTLLPEQEAYLADLYLAVRQDPSAAAGLYRFQKRTVKETEIAVYGIKRLIWRDKSLALRAWDKLQTLLNFSPEQKDEVAYRFALALASKGEPEANFWLNKVPTAMRDEKLMQWLLANKLKHQDWEGVVALFVGHEQLSAGQKYWLAYSHQQLGYREKAEPLWQELAQQRHYYGFLAAARLNLPVQLNAEALTITPLLQQQVAAAPGFKRAKALYEMERYTEARREWNYLTSTSSRDEKLAASLLAAEFDWYDSSIFTLAEIGAWDFVEIRFPLAYLDLFERYSKENRIDLAWSIAIARRESSFAPDARSRADAYGLMQLLPSTAKYIGKSRVPNHRLLQPGTNIRLGTDYLQYLKNKTDGNEVLATASYNAGYYRVKKWLPQQAIPAELWIELIPYTETRDYVKNVYAYRQVYNMRLGKQDNILGDILQMSIGG